MFEGIPEVWPKIPEKELKKKWFLAQRGRVPIRLLRAETKPILLKKLKKKSIIIDKKVLNLPAKVY